MESIPLGQPILRNHYSAPRQIRTQTQLQNLSAKIAELHDSVEFHLSKAKNLEIMATTNKGDAKSRNERICEEFMNKVNIGDKVYSPMDRQFVTVIKKNKKTVGILLENGTSYPIEPFMLELSAHLGKNIGISNLIEILFQIIYSDLIFKFRILSCSSTLR